MEIGNGNRRMCQDIISVLLWDTLRFPLKFAYKFAYSYDRSKEAQVDAAMKILAEPVKNDGTCRTYTEVLNEELDKRTKLELDDSGRVSKNFPSISVPGIAPEVGISVSSHSTVIEDEGRKQKCRRTSNESSVGKENVPPVFVTSSDGGSGQKKVVSGGVHIDLVDEDDSGFNEEMLQQLVRECPIARKALECKIIRDNTITNSGGQTFVGATFMNCHFFINSADNFDAARST